MALSYEQKKLISPHKNAEERDVTIHSFLRLFRTSSFDYSFCFINTLGGEDEIQKLINTFVVQKKKYLNKKNDVNTNGFKEIHTGYS